jgi:transposase-like protein
MTKTPDGIEVIERPRPGRRRRFTAEEKQQLVAEAMAPGSSISLVARRHEIAWSRSLASSGSLRRVSKRCVAKGPNGEMFAVSNT